MQMINADALKAYLQEQYEYDCFYDDDDDLSAGRASAFRAIIEYVNNAPVAEAIPLEWIERKE